LCRNCPLKHVIEGKIEGGEDGSDERTRKITSSYWMALRKREAPGICNRNQ